MTVAELVRLFLASRTVGHAPATSRFYASRLKLLLERHGARPADSFQPGEILALLGEMNALTESQATQRHNGTALQTLFGWAVDEGLLEKKPFRKLPRPAMTYRERLPTKQELAKLRSRFKPDFRRFFEALLQSGARPGELASARIEWIETVNGCRILRLPRHKTARKTGRPREIPIGERLGKILDRAIGQRREGLIFVRSSGRPWTVKLLSARFRTARDALGITREVVLYTTRHAALTRICKTSGIEQAARLAGHAPGSPITSRYVSLDLEYLAACQDRDLDDAPPRPPSPAGHTTAPATQQESAPPV